MKGGAHLFGKALEIGHINADAGGFHPGQHWFQRLLHLLQQRQQLLAHGLQLMAQQQGEAPGDVHIHAAIQAGGLQRHVGEGLFLAHQIGE